MAVFSKLLLLAACSTCVVGGPVPRNHQRRQFTGYFNTSSIISSTSEKAVAQLDTALVVEPIQPTVFTSIAPGITFVNPDGEPLATQDPETVLSTSFITPTQKPTTERSSSVIPTSTTTPGLKQAPSESSPAPTLSSDALSALSSSVKVVENSTASVTSREYPKFTYSPIEQTSSASLASVTPPTSKAPVPTSGGMPGFQHPGSTAPSQPPSNSSSSPTTVASSVAASSVSSGPPVVSSSRSADDLADVTSRIMVTSYTTVYVSAPSPDAAITASEEPVSGSAAPTPAMPSCSEGQEAVPPVASSAALAVPSESLQIPPVVIVTSFTTVMATLAPSEAPQVPATSAVPEPVVPSSSAVSSASEATSASAEPTPPAAPSSPSSPSLESSTSAQPASSSAPPAEPTVEPSPSTTPTPEPSQQPSPSPSPSSPEAPASTPDATSTTTPSASSSSPPPPPAPEPTPSSSSSSSTTATSEGPLIITPIPPSQIFTVTATTTEKETVRETVTVTATA
ncbi:hypothetical protein J3E72DRAFT_401620 [Bipolaris maydis]|nr:hypothetical protein BM1_09814 [Bipolaris maydis]KAJ5029584.1 hypothetical protein J3E73DRAFT_406806 [Bipolaris maydis]KAJ5061670.1 hypothetical protein J3E74DRAFT_449071 [Bipolaris maydis]KAJ6203276.1 hypothetical protein J3E72DRAFT_401620 [Bipolaris maydis]KAJ6275798.1 hypothetical protein PSV08DRAFT_376216 [Bipolaris maydis]